MKDNKALFFFILDFQTLLARERHPWMELVTPGKLFQHLINIHFLKKKTKTVIQKVIVDLLTWKNDRKTFLNISLQLKMNFVS